MLPLLREHMGGVRVVQTGLIVARSTTINIRTLAVKWCSLSRTWITRLKTVKWGI